MNPKTEQTTPTKVKRKHYDEQFKRDAVALLEGGRGATQLARELGVSQWNLRDWKEVFGTGGPQQARGAQQAGDGAASSVALAVEVADLRRELDAVARQRDILKKALAIVAQENPNALR